MPSHKFLRRIERLDRSSPQFPGQLNELLSGNGYKTCILELQQVDATWLIEYLDNVLGTLDHVDLAYWKCLDELGRICNTQETVPRSHVLDVSSSSPVGKPISSGPYKAHEGLLRGSKVRVVKPDDLLESRLFRFKAEIFGEVVKWKHLAHKNIVSVLGVTLNPLQIISALPPGLELGEYIRIHPDTDRVNLLLRISDGLNYLHSRDVVHGGLCGPNIFVDETGCPRITGFGLAVLGEGLGQKAFRDRTHPEYVSYFRWASMQVIWGFGEHTKQADVFAFAMVMVEVFTGQVPFLDKDISRVVDMKYFGERPMRPTHRKLTDKLWALMERCWERDPEKRPEMSVVSETLRGSPGSPPDLSPTHRPSREGVTNETLDLTSRIASVSLFGAAGSGKILMARTILDHDRTEAKFGKNRYSMCCEDLAHSLEVFLKHLSDAIHANHITSMGRLRSHLKSSPPFILLLDGADRLIHGSEEVREAIEELGGHRHVCLITTSRTNPHIRGFYPVEVPTPSEADIRDIFYNLCSLARSSAVGNLLVRLDSSPLSVDLLASCVRENDWDERAFLKAWDREQMRLLNEDNQWGIGDVVGLALRSPAIRRLGSTVRDVLGEIAASPSGVGEPELKARTVAAGEVVDVLCGFSLIYRQNGVVRMASPVRSYFLGSHDDMPGAWPSVYDDDTLDVGDPSNGQWIQMLPQIVKRGFFGLFGIQEDPVNESPTASVSQTLGTPEPYGTD